MLLQAIVLGADVRESVFFDQATGVPKPGYTVDLTVLDAQTHEKYECQLTDGFARLEEIKELKRQGQPAEVLRQMAEQLRAELPPPMANITLEVLRLKGKSAAFIKLVCRFAQVAAAV